jgi:hypothetical protein
VAENTVLKEQLDSGAIAAGYALTSLLGKTDFGLVCSLWLFSQDASGWSLILATPRVKTDGPLQGYKIIHDVLASDPLTAEQLAAHTIAVVRPDTPLIRAVRSIGRFAISDISFGPTPRIPAPKRISMASIDGVFVEDAYVYLIEPE